MDERTDIERCGFLCVHDETVARVLREMPDDETLYDLTGRRVSTPLRGHIYIRNGRAHAR